jgi:hypothetical protein
MPLRTALSTEDGRGLPLARVQAMPSKERGREGTKTKATEEGITSSRLFTQQVEGEQ